MKITKSVCVYLSIIVLSLLSLFIFHKVPVHHLWTGYETLAVPVSMPESNVLDVLKNCGCEDVVSLSYQNKTSFSDYSPVQKKNPFIDYQQKTNSFFFDKSSKYQIYYIPEKFSAAVERSYRVLLKNYNVEACLDSQVRFPWTTPLICFIFAFFLTFFSKQKIYFIVTAFFPLIFTLSQPFFAPAGAVCFLLFGIFLIQNIRRRSGFVYVIRNSFLTVFFFIIPVLFAFAVSFLTGFLLLLCVCASFSLEHFLFIFEQKRTEKVLFKSSLILPAQYVPLVTHFNLRIMASCIFVTGFFLAQFSLSSRFLPSSSAKDLLIPSPARYNRDSAIVSLTDYIEWTWYTLTYPYRSLNSKVTKVENGDTIVIPRFEKNSDGIVQTDEVVFKYDNEFKQKIVDEIDLKSENSMEKLLKRQGNLNSAVFSASGSGSGDLHDFLILILEFLLTPVVLFYLLMRIKKNDKN